MSSWIILLVSLLCSAVGFAVDICFFSVGYGLAIAGIAETIACVLLILYGCRLGGYLLYRGKKARTTAAF